MRPLVADKIQLVYCASQLLIIDPKGQQKILDFQINPFIKVYERKVPRNQFDLHFVIAHRWSILLSNLHFFYYYQYKF